MMVIAAWMAWEIAKIASRTVFTGHSLRRQLDEVQPREGSA